MDWQVEQLRFTWFFTKRPSSLFEKRWSAVADSLPNIEVIQNAPHFLYRAEAQAPEPFGSGWLTFHLEESRMDIYFGGRELIAQSPIAQAPVAGPLEKQFLTMWDYLKQRDVLFATPVNRLAIGFIALSRVSSKVEGYRALDELLESVKIDPEATSDFLYQINRPTKVAFADKEAFVNRLTRWSVLRISTPTVFLHKKSDASGDLIRQGGEEYWVRLEADINTVPGEFDELPPENLVDAFALLKKVADGLVRGGEQL